MTRRRKILILSALLLAVILLLLWWLMRGTPDRPTAQPVVTPVPKVIEPGSPQAQAPQVAERVQASGAETVAKVFAERYGSFSTEAEFGNLRDAAALATPEFAARLLAQADSGTAGGEYYGVTTRVIALTAEEMGETTARFSVSTQRQEAKGSPQGATVRYQAMTVELEKAGEAWLVSDAAWE